MYVAYTSTVPQETNSAKLSMPTLMEEINIPRPKNIMRTEEKCQNVFFVEIHRMSVIFL
jgi:hypothetical protein